MEYRRIVTLMLSLLLSLQLFTLPIYAADAEDALEMEHMQEPEDAPEAGQIQKPEDTPETEHMQEPEDAPETGQIRKPEDTPETEHMQEPEDVPEAEQIQRLEQTPEPEQAETDSQAALWQVSLPDGLLIEPGETITYQTVAAGKLSEPVNGYYPGGVIITAEGQIVIKSGGSLTIGKLAIGSNEPSPVLQGSLREDGLIRVEAGGSLMLNGVTLDTEGEGLLIFQEDGGLVEVYDTDLTGLVHWGEPVVDNTYEQPKSLWLETGRQLTEDLLPTEKQVTLMERGVQRQITLSIQWMVPCGDPTDEITLTGTYLNENGDPVLSVKPLTMAVRWYNPEEIVITDTVWLGENAATAQLEYLIPSHEMAEIWGEISTDSGITWHRWEQILFNEDEPRTYCIFMLPDNTPRLYRLAAVSRGEDRHWVSRSILLPHEGVDTDDIGGNRGGSIHPKPVDRKPLPPEDNAGADTSNAVGLETDNDSVHEYRPEIPHSDTLPGSEPGSESTPLLREDVGISDAPTPPKITASEAPAATESYSQNETSLLEEQKKISLQGSKAKESFPSKSPSASAETSSKREQTAPDTETFPAASLAELSERDSLLSEVPAPVKASAENPVSPALQGVLGTAALAGCILAGIGIARVFPALKKKK